MYKPRSRASLEAAQPGRGRGGGIMRPFSVMRFVAAIVVAVGLSVAAGSPSAAQDDEENSRTAAQEVRELVLKQRERVLAHVAAIMAGDREDADSAEIAKIEEP